MTNLSGLFEDKGSQRMFELISDPNIAQVEANKHNVIFFTEANGRKVAVNDSVFAGAAQYEAWLDALLTMTDAGYTSVSEAKTSVIEASFDPAKTEVHGSIHIVTREVTRGAPALTIRKQPKTTITIDDMMRSGMCSIEMRMFLQQAMHGRLNILISGGSGAGKTTLARALSWFIDPGNRVVTCEEIDELHFADRLPNVVPLTTYRLRDDVGRVVRETTLDDLVRESLRMRADRVIVGETRGKEAYSLVKAANSGHAGSMTTIHADDAGQAVRQLVTYLCESGLSEAVAREQVARAFHLVVQITREKMGRRVIREICEIEPVLEGNVQRMLPLYTFDDQAQSFMIGSRPSRRVTDQLARFGVNLDQAPGQH